ncbi:MAG: hypothetical protein K2O24_04665 [Muribaculaceae bacterium]|nr:hypothetical protein [Muribaculaceae bacterium]
MSKLKTAIWLLRSGRFNDLTRKLLNVKPDPEAEVKRNRIAYWTDKVEKDLLELPDISLQPSEYQQVMQKWGGVFGKSSLSPMV